MELHSNLPKNLVDTDVISVEVTGPFRVRVTHRDGTTAVHRFDPRDFRGDFTALRDPAVFAAAAVIGHCLGWELPGGVYDRGGGALWLHAHGFCDESHDLTAVVER
ncbi:hypothetical protein ABQE69_10695 [Mycolicibacillus trivialis]